MLENTAILQVIQGKKDIGVDAKVISYLRSYLCWRISEVMGASSRRAHVFVHFQKCATCFLLSLVWIFVKGVKQVS